MRARLCTDEVFGGNTVMRKLLFFPCLLYVTSIVPTRISGFAPALTSFHVSNENRLCRRTASFDSFQGSSVRRLQRSQILSLKVEVDSSGAASLEEYKLVKILKDCKELGIVRFVAVTAGGVVLESLGNFNFNYVGPFEIPGRGMYMTLAGPNSATHLEANFECTINLEKVDSLAFDTLYGAFGELYSIRLMSKAQPKPILSILLNYDLEGNGGKAGKYAAGTVEAWKALRARYADAAGVVQL